jgi:hypothetical protein
MDEATALGAPIDLDTPGLAAPLEEGEQVVARRTSARLRVVETSGGISEGTDGTLFLTDRRLLHAGPLRSVPLADITELTIAGDSVLISLADGRGLLLEASSAADLRTAIAVQMKQAQSPSR